MTQSKEKDNLIFVRLFPGEVLYDALKEVCRKHNVVTAVVLSGLGQMKEFTLGYFSSKGDYRPEEFTEPHELVVLTGNISKQGDDHNFHLHAALGTSDKEIIGGHLMGGKIEITAEIVLLKSDLMMQRRIDEKTGLSGLFLT